MKKIKCIRPAPKLMVDYYYEVVSESDTDYAIYVPGPRIPGLDESPMELKRYPKSFFESDEPTAHEVTQTPVSQVPVVQPTPITSKKEVLLKQDGTYQFIIRISEGVYQECE